MKMTRLCGLVALAFVAILILSVPAQALDHPWDGTKLVDTTNISTVSGTSGTPNGDPTDGDGGYAPTQKWYNVFVGWFTGIFGNNDAEKTEQVSDSRAVRSKDEGKKNALMKFNRK